MYKKNKIKIVVRRASFRVKITFVLILTKSYMKCQSNRSSFSVILKISKTLTIKHCTLKNV